MSLTRSLSNSEDHNSKVQVLLEDKIGTYLDRKYRISRSQATKDSYRRIVHRFLDFIQIKYKKDFEQLSAVKKSNSDPIEILDEYLTFLVGNTFTKNHFVKETKSLFGKP